MKRSVRTVLGLALAAALAPTAWSQDNVIPGTDVALGLLGTIDALGREGTFPNGMNGFAMSTTSCNFGSVEVPWLQPMNPNHPMISFLVARELNGRMEQISDRSYVKHGFFALANSQCTSCQGGDPFGGTFLGIGCSDTYATGNNGDNYWLAPADEIDPWLGTWDPVCSYFDEGFPAAAPPFDCDGNRSLSQGQANALGPVGNRINIPDQAFNPVGSPEFYYQGHYVVKGEPAANRMNNLGSRKFSVTLDGGQLETTVSESLLHGSILQRWSGATVSTGDNGNDDGSFHVGVVVTGPVDGLYHYEYAVHNQDNNRAGGGFRIPICPDAQVLNAGFSDIDDDAGNDWTVTQSGSELVFSTPDNPVRWNTFYNFWFDSDAAPEAGTLSIDQFTPGAGADFVTVESTAPLGLYNVFIGEGCSNVEVPSLFATGTPAQATLGNASFGLASDGNEAGNIAVLFYSTQDGSLDLGGGCNLYLGGINLIALQTVLVDSSGRASFALPVPVQANLEGASVPFQAFALRTGGGPAIGLGDLSDGLRVRFGNTVTGCP